MTALLLSAFLSVPAHAQAVLRAPTLAPRLFSAPVLPGPAFTPSLPAAALAAPSLPALSVHALPVLPARALPAPAARPLAAAAADIRQAKAEPAAAAPVLDRLYESRKTGGAAAPAVFAAPSSLQPSGLTRSFDAVRPVLRAEPPAPPQPGWKKAGTVLARAAGVLFGLWGGMKVGDVAYSLALAKLAPFGLLAALPAAAGLAWYLRRREAGLGSRLTWASLLGSFTFSAVGQLVWDLTGSPLGLLAGIVLGAALALYAGGWRRLDSQKQ